MNRKVGEILVEDFGWSQPEIDDARRRQAERGQGGGLIGEFLRKAPGEKDRTTEVAMALLVQRLEPRIPVRKERSFDLLEYSQLGEQLKEDHADISAKVRAYVLVLVGLVLFVAYPLNAELTAGTSRVSEWTALAGLYSSIGILGVVCSLFLGDGVVKSYAFFVKRRWRHALARRQLRAAAIGRGDATETVMPYREAASHVRSGPDIAERPDPEITGVQHNLPFIYMLGAITKLALIAFFVAVWIHHSLEVDPRSMYKGAAIVLALAPWWYFMVGHMCERYHKTLFETSHITVEHPYPRGSTRHLADGRRRSNEMMWGAIYVIGVMVITVLGHIVFQPHPAGARGWWFLWLAGANIAFILARVLHVIQRVGQMRFVN